MKNMHYLKSPLAAAIALSVSSQFSMADGNLEGRVRDTERSISVNGAVIQAQHIETKKQVEVLSEKNGRFRFNSLPNGDYQVRVFLGNEELQQKTVSISDNTTESLTFMLGENDEVVEEILVIGQSAQIQRALDRQRYADNMISAINADAIGQLPDSNAAEALQRVPGLSIERDQGEGRFVRVRGISPDLNAVSVNGTQLPAPESGRRAVALDVVPADLLSALVVTKTLTPDMDANSIGGAIEVESLSALDKEGAFYNMRAETSYDEHTDQTSPALSVSGGNTFELNGEQRLGVAGALSWEKRQFGSANVETGGAWDFDDGVGKLEELEQRDYEIERERLGAALNFDFELDANNHFYLHTLYSEYKDDEQRLANVIEFGEEELNEENELEFSGAGRAENQTGLAEVKKELKDREETQTILATTFGGEHFIDDWTIEYALGYSKANEDEPGGIGAAVFESGEIDGMGFKNGREPTLIASSDFYDAASYELKEVEYTKAFTEDEQVSFKFDISRDLYVDDNPVLVKFGAKSSQREKTQDEDEYVFEDFEDAGIAESALPLTNFEASSPDYDLDQFGPGISPSAVHDLLGQLDREQYKDEEKSQIADHTINEDINAAYVMGRMDIEDWRVLAGVRYEHTQQDFKGVSYDGDSFAKNRSDNEYAHILPALHARYQLSDDAQLRAAWTNSVVRPTFEQLAPSFVDDGEEAEFGNPELDAMTSSNFDLGIEYFTGTAGVLSAFIFTKSINDFVLETDLAGSPQWSEYDEVKTYQNGDAASIQGIELAYSQKMSMLSSPFDGLLVSANVTVSESDAQISAYEDGVNVKRDISLPNQSDVTGNFVLGYEKNALTLRLAANYKSEYLLELGDLTDSQKDVYQDEQVQLDFSSAYRFMENFKATFEIANITDEAYYTYVNKMRYNHQYEDYGPTYKLGITYSNF